MDDALDQLGRVTRTFDDMVEALQLGLSFQMHVSPDGRSRRFVRLGGACRELLGDDGRCAGDAASFLARIAPEHRDALLAAEAEAVKARRAYAEDVRLLRPDGRACWRRIAASPVLQPDRSVVWDGLITDVTEARRGEEAMQKHQLLLGELAHRAKNGMQVMMGIVAQTARGVGSVPEFEEVLQGRLKSMADSQDLVTASGGRPVLLRDVLVTTLTPFDVDRFEGLGDVPDLTVVGEVAVTLGLLLHEFATNAVKYGALSTSAGRVRLELADVETAATVLSWREAGGPEVRRGERRGFGSRLIEVALAPQGGGVAAEYPPDGFRAKITFPAEEAPTAGA